MKHAGAAALDQLADLLAAIRTLGAKEPRPGVFYRKGKAWLHFHAFMMARQMMADVGAGAEGGERVSPMPQSTAAEPIALSA